MTVYLPVRVPTTAGERAKLKTLRNTFFGKRIFIVGNGPSLNKHDLSLLKGEYTFGVNSIFLKEKTGFKPTFYTVEDSHVLNDNFESILNFDVEYKFFLAHYRDKIGQHNNVFYLDSDLGFYRDTHPFGGIPRFSRDASEVVFAGQSVTLINLQIAYFLGFREFYLIGMDFHYDKPTSVIVKGNTWISTEDDPNHFDPSYFGAGKKWHDPQLDKVAINYMHAKKVLEASGCKIFNASIGGKLDFFPRVNWGDLFNKSPKLPSKPIKQNCDKLALAS